MRDRTATGSRPAVALAHLTCLFLTLAVGFASHAASPGFFKCKNAQGKVIYSDTPCSTQFAAGSGEGASGAGSRPRSGDAGALTEKQIRAMLLEYDHAMQRLDADAVLGLMSDDARVEVYLRRGGATGRRSFRKNEYAKFMRDSLRDISEYTSRRESLHVAVSPNGMQGEVNSRISEDWRQAGQALTMASDEQYLVELREGKPKFVWVHVSATGEPRVKR